jgi:hypothetical protein
VRSKRGRLAVDQDRPVRVTRRHLRDLHGSWALGAGGWALRVGFHKHRGYCKRGRDQDRGIGNLTNPSNVTGHFNRHSEPAYLNRVSIALGSEGELGTQLEVGKRVGLISRPCRAS